MWRLLGSLASGDFRFRWFARMVKTPPQNAVDVREVVLLVEADETEPVGDSWWRDLGFDHVSGVVLGHVWVRLETSLGNALLKIEVNVADEDSEHIRTESFPPSAEVAAGPVHQVAGNPFVAGANLDVVEGGVVFEMHKTDDLTVFFSNAAPLKRETIGHLMKVQVLPPRLEPGIERFGGSVYLNEEVVDPFVVAGVVICPERARPPRSLL